MNLEHILQQDCIKVPLEGKDKKSVTIELVDLLNANTNGILLNRDAVLQAVLDREQTRSTGIGSGIAIPHGKCKEVRELTMAVGLCEEPIDFESVDGKPVKIIFLLVSPADQTGPHIQALAQISRLMLNDDFKQKLEQADSAEKAYELLSSNENK